MNRLFTFSKAEHGNNDFSPIQSQPIRTPEEFRIEFHVWEREKHTNAGKNISTIQSPISANTIENVYRNKHWKGEEDLHKVYRLR
jgi:hypothetical protein